jgi:hypothetical protein
MTTMSITRTVKHAVKISAGKSGFVGSVPFAVVAHKTMQSRIFALACSKSILACCFACSVAL